MKKIVLKLVRVFGKALPLSLRSALIKELLHSFNENSQDSRESLTQLLDLDSILYACTSKAAKSANGGEHPKHRLTDYASFFISQVRKGEAVIDLGCGDGYVACRLAAEYPESSFVGIDCNPVSIETARRKNVFQNLEFILGNIFSDLPARPFDTIILSNVFEHIEHRTTFLKDVLRQTNAIRVLIRVPMFNRDWRVPLKKELGVEWRLDNTHYTEFTVESFKAEMDEIGLAIDHLEVQWSEIWACVSRS